MIIIYLSVIILGAYCLLRDKIKHPIFHQLPLMVFVLLAGFVFANNYAEDREVSGTINTYMEHVKSNTSHICPIGYDVTQCKRFFTEQNEYTLNLTDTRQVNNTIHDKQQSKTNQ